MRKLILQMMISIDGFFEGENRDISWHNVDEQLNNHSIKLLDQLDTLLFGRVTYELMAGYWPTEKGLADDPQVAQRMNRLHKVVASRTLKKVDWNNSRLIEGDVVEEVRKLKQQPGKDIAVGGSDLATSLLPHNLIDEFLIFINPVALGKGKRLFEGMTDTLNLKLIGCERFQNGNVMLRYVPVTKDKTQ